MLSESTITLLVDEKETPVKIKDLYNKFLEATKDQKKSSLLIKVYDPLKKKFFFRTVKNMRPVPLSSKVKEAILDFSDVEQDLYLKVLLDLTTKIYVKTNLETTVNVGFISMVGKKPLIAHVENDVITFKKLTKIDDYVKPTAVEAPPVKRRGRKSKKATPVQAPVLEDLRVYSIELSDGSLILCDKLLQR